MPALLSLGKQSNLRGARRRLCVFLSQADSEERFPTTFLAAATGNGSRPFLCL